MCIYSRNLKSFSFFNLQNYSFSYCDKYSGQFNVVPIFSNYFFTDRSDAATAISYFKNHVYSQYGYYSVLHVKGIGFKVFFFKKTHTLYFSLGYNHLVKFKLNDGVFAKVRKQYVLLFSNSKSDLGRAIYGIRHLRFPDPYRGKGIRYRFQIMKFKPGKQR